MGFGMLPRISFTKENARAATKTKTGMVARLQTLSWPTFSVTYLIFSICRMHTFLFFFFCLTPVGAY